MAAVGLSAGTAFVDIKPNLTGFVGDMQRGMSALSGRISAVGSTLTKRLTLPVVGAGIAAVKMASDFQTSMSHIVGLVGVSQRQVDKWSDQILNLSRTLPQSPKELADAMYFITSAGFSGSSAMKVLEASAKAAAAGLGETMSVADAVTSAVNAYGEKTLSAAEATDILTNTVRLGKAEASSIAPVLGSILPTASELGVSFNDVAAAIAAMTRTGDSAATAATKTNAIFSSLVKTTKQQDEAFKNAGFTAEQLRDSIAQRGLLPTLLDLKEATGGNIEVLAEMFPNVRALRGVLSLTGKQADKNAEIFGKMADSAGLTDDALKAVSDTAEFKMKSALSSVQATAIKFGEVLLPFVAKAAELLGKLFDAIGNLSPHVRNLILIFAGVAAAIGPIIFLFGKLLLLASPIGLAVTGIALAAYAVVQNWDKVGPVVMPILRGIKDLVLRAWDAIRSMNWQEFTKSVTGALGAIARTIGSAVGEVVRWFERAWDATAGLRQVITFVAKQVGKGLLNAFGALADVWKTSIMPALRNLKDAFMALWNPVLKYVAIAVGAVVAVLLVLAAKALPVVIRLIGTLIRWLSDLIKFIAQVIQFVAKLIEWFVRLGVKIVSAVARAVGAVIRFFRELPGKIVRFLASLPERIGNLFTRLKDKALDIAGKVLDWFREMPSKAAGFITSLPEKIGDVFRRMANAIISWWNRIDLKIDFTLPDVKFVPGLDGQRIVTGDLIPDVPLLGKGGIVTRPTLAVIGEAGPEAVVPLSRRSGPLTVRIVDWREGIMELSRELDWNAR
jgi:TP901 family phage tail tape measure protein